MLCPSIPNQGLSTLSILIDGPLSRSKDWHPAYFVILLRVCCCDSPIHFKGLCKSLPLLPAWHQRAKGAFWVGWFLFFMIVVFSNFYLQLAFDWWWSEFIITVLLITRYFSVGLFIIDHWLKIGISSLNSMPVLFWDLFQVSCFYHAGLGSRTLSWMNVIIKCANSFPGENAIIALDRAAKQSL